MKSQLKHQNFIDWMKAMGMFLIIFGHVVGNPFNLFNEITQPAYTKQLGVAFFVFITGWSLANDTRPGLRVVFNRLFAIYFYGILFALLLSIIFIFTKNDTNPSNYLPFFLGINVFFNNFPANPTTWYIGTYLHLIVFWYLFMQGKVVRKRHLAIAFIVENISRFSLMAIGKDYIAYMLLPNWITIFLLGMYVHKQKDIDTKTMKVVIFILAWLCILAGWAFIGSEVIGFNKSFPFRNINMNMTGSLLLTSFLVSVVYATNTLIFFQIARRLSGNWMVSFFARNTLIIFIVHMPIVFELSPFLYRLIETVWIKQTILIITLYFGLAVFSEILQRFINIKFLSEKAWILFNRVIASFQRS